MNGLSDLELWQECALFVSSTFRDMHAERDRLRDQVFSPLREELMGRRCRLRPIELRWGISTEAEADREASILRVCLREIDRARPLIVVLLGERYGWRPPAALLEAVLDRSRWPRLPVALPSVTELEIRYGALLAQARPLFLLRRLEPQVVPVAQRHAYFDDAPAQIHALRDTVKEFAERHQAPLIEYRAGWDAELNRPKLSQHFGRDVREALWHILDAQTRSRLQPVPARWEELAARGVDDALAAQLDSLAVRQRGWECPVVREIRTFVAAEASSVYLLVGASGSGKSVLFAVLAQILASEEALVLTHVARSGLRSTDALDLLRRWLHALAAELDPSGANDFEQVYDLPQLRSAFQTLLGDVVRKRRVVLLLDGLDQLDPTPAARDLAWLPSRLPAGVKLVVTSAPCEAEQVASGRPAVERHELDPLDEGGARDVVLTLCRREGKEPSSSLIQAAAERATSSTDPGSRALWATLATQRLLFFDAKDFQAIEAVPAADAERAILDRQLHIVADLPSDVGALHAVVFDRARVAAPWLDQLLALLAAARQGLRERDFRAILGLSDSSHDLAIADCRRLLGSVLRQHPALGTWDFAHQPVRRHVWRPLEPLARRQLHERIAGELEQLPSADVLRLEVMYHWLEARQPSRAAAHLGRASATPSERQTAVRTLADHVLFAEAAPRGLDFVVELVAAGDVGRCASRLVFELLPALRGRAKLPTRERLARACIALLRAQPQTSERLHELLEAQRELRRALSEQADAPSALNIALEALATADRLYGLQPERADWHHDAVLAQVDVADAQRDVQDIGKAQAAYQAATSRCDALVLEFPDDATYELTRSGIAGRVGDFLARLGDRGAARSAYQEAQDVASKLWQHSLLGSKPPRAWATLAEKLGELSRSEEKLEEAREHFTLAGEVLEGILIDAPRDRQLQHQLSRLRGRIADLLRRQARLPEALEAYRAFEHALLGLQARDPDDACYEADRRVCATHIADIVAQLGS